MRPYLGTHGGDVELLDVTDDGRRPAAAAGQLRRLPVVVGDPRARRRGRDRGRRPGGDRRSRWRAAAAHGAGAAPVIPVDVAADAAALGRPGPEPAPAVGTRVPEVGRPGVRARSAASTVGGHRAARAAGSGRTCSPSATVRRAARRSLAGARARAPRSAGRSATGAHAARPAAPTTTYAGPVPPRRRRAAPRPAPVLVERRASVVASPCPAAVEPRDQPRRPGAPLGDAAADQRAAARAGPTASAARCAPSPIAEQHQHVVNLDSRALMCTCRACYLLFTDRAGRPALPRRAGPLPVLPGLRARRGATGTRWRSRSAWPSSSPTRCSGRTVAFYPGPAGATESELPLDAWDARRGGQPAARHRAAPTSRRCCVRGARTASDRVRPATWCRSTPATSWSAGCGRLWRGFDGGQEARARSTTFFAQVDAAQPRPRPGGVADERPRRSPCSTSSPSRTPPRRS